MPVQSRLHLVDDPAALAGANPLVVIGRKSRLLAPDVVAAVPLPEATWRAMVEAQDGGDWGATASTWAEKQQVVVGVLPEACSRHNSPSRAWAIPPMARRAGGRGEAGILLALESGDHLMASLLAIGRAFPLYSQRSGALHEQKVKVAARTSTAALPTAPLQPALDAVREAGRLVDTPTSELGTHAFVEQAREVARRSRASIKVISGEMDLRVAGLGGIWGVGKAARQGPALVCLEHKPAGARRTVAWVGKGIVYDTGGLSLKAKESMPGMKGDMGGAAAVLSAFEAAVAMGFPERLIAVLAVAENAIGPDALRPDDVIRLHSGRTVEVNNTDAEGRIVLADALSWLLRRGRPDRVVDVATLTGAATITTGRLHAAIYSNDAGLEAQALEAGRLSGDVCYPLIYAPELLRKEFKSSVADMKNSVKDRNNAQSSAAALFIESHLGENPPPWLHVDIAGPAWDGDGRGTGVGVGLLLALGAG